MLKAGNVFNNERTGEYGYVRVGTEETNGQLLVVDLRVRPGGAVIVWLACPCGATDWL
jgi:hypothetical protein